MTLRAQPIRSTVCLWNLRGNIETGRVGTAARISGPYRTECVSPSSGDVSRLSFSNRFENFARLSGICGTPLEPVAGIFHDSIVEAEWDLFKRRCEEL